MLNLTSYFFTWYNIDVRKINKKKEGMKNDRNKK